jgi:hypothetical protein
LNCFADTHNWHDERHDLGPWWDYFLGILIARDGLIALLPHSKRQNAGRMEASIFASDMVMKKMTGEKRAGSEKAFST